MSWRTAGGGGAAVTGEVLLVGDDPDLVAACGRVAAAAGVRLTVSARAPRGRAWDDAALVVLTPGVGPVPGARSGVVLAATAAGQPAFREAAELGAQQVVVLPDAEAWLGHRMVEAVEAALPRGRLVGVAGGCGGAGASVLAVALARTAAASGRSVLVVDADPLGGGIDLVLAAEAVDGLRWPDLATLRGPVQPGLLTELLPRVDGVHVLSWGTAAAGADPGSAISPEGLDAVLASARVHFDVVVVDLPRALPPGAAGRAAATACDVVLLVVPARVRSAAAALGVAAGLDPLCADVRLVVRQTRGGLTSGAVADALGRPVAAVVASEPGLGAALDRGEPPGLRPRGPLGRACRRLLDGVLGVTDGSDGSDGSGGSAAGRDRAAATLLPVGRSW